MQAYEAFNRKCFLKIRSKLRGIKPKDPAKKAGLVQLPILKTLLRNFSK